MPEIGDLYKIKFSAGGKYKEGQIYRITHLPNNSIINNSSYTGINLDLNVPDCGMGDLDSNLWEPTKLVIYKSRLELIGD